MEAIIATFHIDWKILVAQLVNFGLVAGVLWWFALKPLVKVMTERTKTIEDGLTQAKRIAEKAKETEVERAAILANARTQARQLIQATQQKADQQKSAALEQAKAEVQKVVESGKTVLAQERAGMLQSLKAELADLVVAASSKVMAGAMDKTIDHKLFERAMKEIAHTGKPNSEV